MKATEIALMINEIKDGVNRSSIGPIYMNTLDIDGNPKMSQLAYQTYLCILNSACPKNIDFNMKEGV